MCLITIGFLIKHLLSLLIFSILTFSLFPSLIPLTCGFVVEHCNGVCLLFSYPLRLKGTHSIPNELHRRGVNVNFSRFTVRTTPYFITRESGMNYTL